MKKNPILRAFLAVLLVFSMVSPFAFATETETQETATVNTEPTFFFPVDVSGDASVSTGNRSINAHLPLLNPGEVEVELKSALMYELGSGTLLFDYNIDARVYPASTTKIMTCLLALEHCDLDEIVTISQSVQDGRDPDGSNCDLMAGEKLSVRDLIYCLMVASANDAGSAISEHVAGSEKAFVAMMNEKAKELGCTDTHFANPHGLHNEEHYTTARDMAKIMLCALENDFFYEVFSTASYEVPATNICGARKLRTTNYMIDRMVIEHHYDSRVIGGKTGFTTPAGRCFVAVSESGGMRVLSVVMGCETAYNDEGILSYGSFEQTHNLIDYVYDHYTAGRILSPDAVLESFPVTDGENDVQVYVKEAVDTVLPVDLVESQLRYEYILDDGTLTAPIEKDEVLGIVRVWYQSKCVAQRELYAAVGSKVKQLEPVRDLALRNDPAQASSNLWHIVLLVVIFLLVLVVLMLAVSAIRASIIRSRRNKRRRDRRRSQ